MSHMPDFYVNTGDQTPILMLKQHELYPLADLLTSPLCSENKELIPELRRQGQEDFCEFEACLVDIVSSRSPRNT